MKKLLVLLLTMVVMTGVLAGCSDESTEDTAADAAAEDNEGDVTDSTDYSEYKIAMISDTIGNEQFILQAYDALEAMADEYGFAWTSIECTDTAAWEENSRGASEDGYDLIVGVGWQAGEVFSTLADEYTDIDYAVIDTTAENDAVKSLAFNTTEGCYVLGVMVGTAFADENLFGYVCNFQDQASYEYRYGFSEGVLSVNPDAEFMYNYANSYSDTSIVYEYTMQQQAAGCTFIFGGVSSSSNSGIYQAALELAEAGTPIYTSGLSIDQTTEENPYIIGGVLKNTDVCMTMIVEEFLAGDFTGGALELGIAEGAFGVVGLGDNDFNYRNEEIMTDEVVEAGKAAAEQITSGELVIEAPAEEE